MRAYLRDGLVDINPAGQGVDPEVFRLFTGHRVRDGRVGAEVVVMCSHAQETGPDHGVLAEEVCGKRQFRRVFCASFVVLKKEEKKVSVSTSVRKCAATDENRQMKNKNLHRPTSRVTFLKKCCRQIKTQK